MTELFDAIRQLCPAAAWTNGVSLARGGSVSRVASSPEDADEILVKVHVQGLAVPASVRLYPEEAEWDCDCDSPLDACEHAAAAVIAIRRGAEVEAVPDASLEYRFSRTTLGLHLERGFVTPDGDFEPVHLPLRALAAGRLSGPSGFVAAKHDLNAERYLGDRLPGVIEARLVRPLFASLSECKHVSLDGEPVRVSSKKRKPVLRVSDVKGGIRLALVAPSHLPSALGDEPSDDANAGDGSERFANGILLSSGILYPYEAPLLSAQEYRQVSGDHLFSEEELPELVATVLPSLAKRMRVDVQSRTVPKVVTVPPRLCLHTERIGAGLRVQVSLVYGDPPIAKIVDGAMLRLGRDVPVRDRNAEVYLAERAREALGMRLFEFQDLEPEQAVDWVQRLEKTGGLLNPARGQEQDSIEWSGTAHEDFRIWGRLEAKFAPEADRSLPVVFETDNGTRTATPAEVLRAFRSRSGDEALVPLIDGGFARLPKDWMLVYGDTLADVLAARSTKTEAATASVFDLAKLHEALDAPAPPALADFDALARAASGRDGIVDLPTADIPVGLREELRDYQKTGVDWLAFLRRHRMGALLADDMGLGKTLQVLAILPSRGTGGSSRPTLVVAPTSVLPNWIAERNRFRPDLSVCLFHGADRVLDPDADLVLTSHALLRLERERLAAIEWDCVVIDESQAIKNPESQLAQAAYTLSARFRISLTGTPVENRLTDLWSQFHFLNPGFLGGLSDFESRYVKPIASGDKDLLRHLRTRIGPFFLRRVKAEAAPELPPRSELSLFTELTPEERRLYEALRGAARRDVVEQLREGGGVMAALEALLRLRQAACHPNLVPGQEASSSSKIETLMGALETASEEGHKSLVFSQWTSMLDLIEPHLAKRELSFLRLDGSTRDRGSVVASFQKSDDCSVFLISLKAGGTGLNLTAADHVFLVDPWWNPAVEQQAFDRAHRIGQTKPVFVHRLIARHTVEEKILELQEQKRALAESATGIEASSAGLSQDELMELLD